nr:pentapeptide repeat-containing protein [Leptolyngbya sp. FACHB-321]
MTNFSQAYLYKANLILADLREANFFEADLSRASLQSSQLFMANLASTQLDQARLSEANLFMSILVGADLSGASLSYSNLSRADLTGAILIATEALATDFTEAIFTEACLQDWNINSETKLEKAECDYIYLRVDWYEEDEEIKGNFFERRPSNPNQKFAQGEFTKLLQKALSTVDLIFRNGVDWAALLISLEKLRVEAEGAELSIHAIENKNDGAFVVRVNVPPDADKATVEIRLKHEYELALKVLGEKYRYELKAKDIEIESYRRENTNIMRLAEWAINRPINVQAIATAESRLMSETFNTDLRGANITNYANKLQDNARQQAILHNYAPKQRQTLAEAAAEIQQLLEQLSQSYPTTTQTEKMALVTKAVEAIEKNPTLKARVVGALKAGGIETLKELIDNPLVNVLLAALEGWQEAE